MQKKNIIILTLIILGIVSVFGLSYAYFVSNISTENKGNSNTSISTGSAVEAILEIPNKSDDTKIIPGYKTSKEYILKGKGDSNSIPTNASLVVSPTLGDFSKYVYWHLYKSDEEITCTRNLDTSSLEIKYISNCIIPDSAKLVLSGNSDTTHINITVNYNTNDKYYLVTEYLDNNKDQSNLMNKSFSIDVSLERVSNTIQDNIIASLDTSGKCPTLNGDGSVKVTAIESKNSLLCSAPDNYGTSYYFRGNVARNYVKFASYYWRIIRINGDGSIRLIYDGTSAHENGESSTDRIIGKSAFNEIYNDNAYVGYMYGTPGSSTYEDTHKNINDSTIKKYIDTWYENHLLNTEYEQYLGDNNFCGDRSISSNNGGKGYGKEFTFYRWGMRPWSNNVVSASSNKVTLKCAQKNDSYTVNDYEIGNASLKYKIGLINTDELVVSGGWQGDNSNYYNYSGNQIWTMTPNYLDDVYHVAALSFTTESGAITFGYDAGRLYGVKPVINLKPNALKSGLGTIESPYLVTK